MSPESDIYRVLQKHLDTGPVGFPATESGIDIRLLRLLFTPEEAILATYLSPVRLEPAGRIYRRLKIGGIEMTREEFDDLLERMCYKGTVLVYEDGYPEKHYKNAGVTAGGIVDFQVDRLTEELVDTFHRYHEERFARAEMTGSRSLPQLRTIPVEKSVPVPEKHLVSTCDDVRRLVEAAPGPFAVANCVCRQTRDIRGESCTYSGIRETCLQIGPDHARQYISMGIGRPITREEVFAILDRAQEAGFILQPENSQKPEAICCCCGDCCGLLSAVLKSPRPADLYATNYYASVNPSLCQACGRCVERCQLRARTIADGIAMVNLDRCIGCGNCVVTCESGASRLVRKENPLVPPKDKETTLMKILAGKVGRWNMFKIRLKMLLGMRV